MIDTPEQVQDDSFIIQPSALTTTNNELNDMNEHESFPTSNESNDTYEEIGITLEAEMLQNTELDDDSHEMMNEEELTNNEDFFENNEQTENDSFMESMEAYELQLQNEMHNVHHEVVSNNNPTPETSSQEPSDIPTTTPSRAPSTTPNTVPEISEEGGVDINISGRPRRTNARAGVEMFEPTLGGKEHFSYRKKCMLQRQHKASQRKPLRARVTLLMREARKKSMNSRTFLQLAINTVFLSAQMNTSQDIKRYGDRAVAALIKECVQLDKGAFPGKPVVEPVFADDLTPDERARAMSAVAIIKEKRCGKVKGRICADGSKEKRYLQSEDTISSPTVSNEGIMGSFMIDAHERRSIAVVDIPGAYLHASMKHDKRRVLMKLQGKFVDFMCKANNKYAQYVTYERGKKVLYLKLLRALYGCIESALLWYELFSSKLKTLGFTLNPYDKCIANKIVDGKQCTVVWYVDDAKISHEDLAVVRGIVSDLEEEFGKLSPTYGNTQEYLGMKIHIDDNQIVHIDMRDQICEIIGDFSETIEGKVSSPASKHLMHTNVDSPPLHGDRADEFHSVTAKLLYLEKRARPDIETAVSYLTTRVSDPNESDWCKLRRVLVYLQHTKDDVRRIGCDSLENIFTWIDAAYAVHNNMRSHTGGVISFGWGTLHTKSSKQKLNTKSSTEAEVVGMSEYVPIYGW